LNSNPSPPAGKSFKGQAWTFDFTAGMIILLAILLFFIFIWNGLAMRWNSVNEYRQMQFDSLFAAEALMSTTGHPSNWETLPAINSTTVDSLGLVNGRNELNNLKLEKLVSINSTSYSFVKDRLGLSRYEFGLRITNLAKDSTYHDFGRFAGPLNNSVVFERLGMLNGSVVLVHLEVWK